MENGEKTGKWQKENGRDMYELIVPKMDPSSGMQHLFIMVDMVKGLIEICLLNAFYF